MFVPHSHERRPDNCGELCCSLLLVSGRGVTSCDGQQTETFALNCNLTLTITSLLVSLFVNNYFEKNGLHVADVVRLDALVAYRHKHTQHLFPQLEVPYDTIRYDTRCYFNVRSKANMSQLNLPHGTDN